MWKLGIIAEKGVFVCRARTAGIPLFTPLGGFFLGGGGGSGGGLAPTIQTPTTR